MRHSSAMSSSFEFGDWIFLLTSVFEMLIFCGFQTGWSSLVYVLVEERIFSHLCIEQPSPDGVETVNVTSPALMENLTLNNCPAQQEMLNLAYTLATSISALAAFPIGIVVDSVGPRLVRIISGMLLGLSCLLFSFLNKNNPGLLFVGLSMACIAGLVLSITPQTCMNRFKTGRSLIIGIYSGAWVCSSLTFLVFKIFYEQGGVRFAYFFRFLAVSCVFMCINAALLYPNKITITTKGKQGGNDDGKNKNFIHKNFKNKQFSGLRYILESFKTFLGLTDRGSSERNQRSDTCLEKPEELSQLLPDRVSSIDTSKIHPGNHFSEKTDTELSDKTSGGTEKFIPDRTKTVSYVNYKSPTHISEKCCDFKKLTYAECTAANTNMNCLKHALSHTSLGERKLNEDICQEDNKQNYKPEEVKPCRSSEVQPWTASTAEAYLKSGLSHKHCALSSVHIWGEIFVIACKLRMWFYVGTFSNHISELSGGNRETVAEYVNIFGLSHLGAFVFAPLFGLIAERHYGPSSEEFVSPSSSTEKAHQKFMMDIEDTTKAVEFIIKCNKDKILKLNDAILVTACSAIVFCLLTLVPNLIVQVITFQIYTFLRVSYNALFASVLIIIFPANHLGKLMGLSSCLGAVFSLLQYPLFMVMEEWFNGRLLEVNVALWLLCMLTFGLPIYLWRKASRHDPDSLALVAV